jgi:hypothetical protein
VLGIEQDRILDPLHALMDKGHQNKLRSQVKKPTMSVGGTDNGTTAPTRIASAAKVTGNRDEQQKPATNRVKPIAVY